MREIETEFSRIDYRKTKKLQTPGKSDTIKKISMEKGKRNMEVTFESLGLSEAMLKALEEKGYAVFLRKG